MGMLREWLVAEHLKEREQLEAWLEEDQREVINAHTRLDDYKFCNAEEDEILWAELMYNEAVRYYAKTQRDLEEWEERYGHLV